MYSRCVVSRHVMSWHGNSLHIIASLWEEPSVIAWWRHQMETFSALLAICAGNSSVIGEFSTQRPVTRSFDVFFDLRLNKRLSKQSWGRWFETPSYPLRRQSNAVDSPSQESVMLGINPLFCFGRLKKMLDKQSNFRWFETLLTWPHRYATWSSVSEKK